MLEDRLKLLISLAKGTRDVLDLTPKGVSPAMLLYLKGRANFALALLETAEQESWDLASGQRQFLAGELVSILNYLGEMKNEKKRLYNSNELNSDNICRDRLDNDSSPDEVVEL